jgi:hypothetical protein
MSKTSAPHNKTVKLDTTRVAIVHDWLYGGGAELVVEQLHKLFPEAPIYTSYCSDTWRARLDGKVVTGWLQYLGNGRLRKFVPFLRIWWFSRLDLIHIHPLLTVLLLDSSYKIWKVSVDLVIFWYKVRYCQFLG